MAENDNGSLGKKIFFLSPTAFVQNQVVAELAQDEFEVYIVKDTLPLRKALRKFPDSVVFITVTEKTKENETDGWIRDITGNPETAGIQIGILSSVNDENLRRKYIGQFNILCGFTVLIPDLNTLVRQLTAVLNGVNAKGRRKYIRALTDGETNTTLNLPMNGTFVHGKIKDISVVGLSCVFSDDPELVKNSLFENMQLRLQTQLLKAEGIVFGSRVDGNEKSYVFIFTQRVDPSVRTRIRKYIQFILQSKMDDELK